MGLVRVGLVRVGLVRVGRGLMRLAIWRQVCSDLAQRLLSAFQRWWMRLDCVSCSSAV